jgi:hypothetical protein
MNEKENNTMKMNEMNYAHKEIAIVSNARRLRPGE